ncbi:MAG: hypothetical protein HY904_09200 [Deltaproteobacteria bacterium]|nr:hypothetical protein [Deltaproteobacteria bacterium]
MRWGRILGWAVVIAVIVIAATWQTPAAGPRRAPRAERERPAPARMPVPARADAGWAPDAAKATVMQPPTAGDPGGYCDGPAGPAGYARPNAGHEVGGWLANQEHPLPAGAMEAVRQAWASHSAEEALELAGEATRAAPGHAGTQATLGLMARRAGRPFLAAESLARAVSLSGDEGAVLRELADALAVTGRTAEALHHWRRYATAHPDDWEAQRRVRLLETAREVEADFRTHADPWFPVSSHPDVPAERVAAVQQALRNALPRVVALLGPLRDPVAVSIYRERADLLATTCAQGWAHAVFDGQMRFQDESGGVLRRPEALEKVAAHELTHVLQRRTRARADGWLTEGVARWIAHEEDRGYLRTLAALAANGTCIPFSSMMGPLMVLEHAEDSALAYDQALMMVHWVVSRVGADGLAALLRHEQRDGEAALAGVLGLGRDALTSSFMDWARGAAPRGD